MADTFDPSASRTDLSVLSLSETICRTKIPATGQTKKDGRNRLDERAEGTINGCKRNEGRGKEVVHFYRIARIAKDKSIKKLEN